MSVLRRAIETRSLTDDLAGAFPGDVTGTVGWQQGMVWNGYGPDGPVTVDGAMQLSAVYACLRLISEAIATLPIDVFRKEGEQRVAVQMVPAYLTFELPQMSRIVYLSQVMMSLLTDGNAFVATPRDALGEPVDLVPLDPGMVQVQRQTQDPTPERPFRKGSIYFTVQGRHYSSFDIMHIPGMMLAGALRGVSPIAAARSVIEGGRSAQDYGKSFTRNMSVPPAVIEMPPMEGNDSEAEGVRARRMAETWRETHGGSNNAGKVGVLTGGAKLTTVAITPADAQWLESKRFGIAEIARFYGAPNHLIGDATGSTSWGSGLAEQNTAFGQFTLRPWTERVDDAHTRLLSTHGMRDAFTKLNLDAGLRASTQARYEAYKVAIDAGIMTPEEARALEDWAPLPGTIDPGSVEALGALVRAGFDPVASAAALGLPPITHTGRLPVTVQSNDPAPGGAQ